VLQRVARHKKPGHTSLLPYRQAVRLGVALVDRAAAVVAGGVVGVADPESPARVAGHRVHRADAAERGVTPVVGVVRAPADHQLVDAGDVGAVRGTLVLDADGHRGVGPAGAGRADVVVTALRVAGVPLDVHPHGHTLAGCQRSRRRRQRQRVIRRVDVVRAVARAGRHIERAARRQGGGLQAEDDRHHCEQTCEHRRPGLTLAHKHLILLVTDAARFLGSLTKLQERYFLNCEIFNSLPFYGRCTRVTYFAATPSGKNLSVNLSILNFQPGITTRLPRLNPAYAAAAT
jgi:hypothetical protein